MLVQVSFCGVYALNQLPQCVTLLACPLQYMEAVTVFSLDEKDRYSFENYVSRNYSTFMISIYGVSP